jgi:hypothetical protein
MNKIIRYVIVVHGIGEQRKNETVIKIVNRFAEARRGAGELLEVLTLGKASGQTGTSKPPTLELPWLEFKGISANLNVAASEPFFGEVSRNGENIRFVDLCWSDVMQDNSENVVEDVHLWAKGLIGRLKLKNDVPDWIRRTLELFADMVLLVKFGMNFRFKKLSDLILIKFLGDVQQYGEYPRCRGLAVRRFHELMSRVEAWHRRSNPGCEARYTVIAHSLGTIMSMDALLYAHMKLEIRADLDEAPSDLPNLPFPGYIEEAERIQARRWVELSNKPEDQLSESDLNELSDLQKNIGFLDNSWVDRIDAFVTLGSPIDKYLIVWWLNYLYLNDPTQWLEDRRDPKHRIAHFNYSDEQDPVGHKLDVAQTAPGFTAAFETRQDIVFNRYTVPGAAHNEYWNDSGLFDWILRNAVDLMPDPGEAPNWFKVSKYRKLLDYIYTYIPLTVILLNFFTLTIALRGESVHGAIIAIAVFTLVAIFGRKLLDLSIWWRQIQRLKGKEQWEESQDPKTTDKQARCLGYETDRFKEMRAYRTDGAKRFRRWARIWVVVNVVLGGLVAGAHSAAWPQAWIGPSETSNYGLLWWLFLTIIVAGATVLFYTKVLRLKEDYRSSDHGKVDLNTVLTGFIPIAVIGLLTNFWLRTQEKGFENSFLLWVRERINEETAFYLGTLFVVSGIVLAYRWVRYRDVRSKLDEDIPQIDFSSYSGYKEKIQTPPASYRSLEDTDDSSAKVNLR